MPFGRPTLESERSRVFGPTTAPIKDLVISKVMRSILPFDWYWLNVRVVPDERPEIFGVDLIETLQPAGDALRFAALKTLRQAIKQIVVRVKVSAGMRARDLFAFARASQRPFKDVAKIEYVLTAGQHRMRHILVHLMKARKVVQVFARRVRLRVEVMDQPGRREDPILETFVVVTVLRIRCQHPIVEGTGQLCPAGGFRRFTVERVGGDAQTRNRNEDVILAIGKSAPWFWFEVIGQ